MALSWDFTVSEKASDCVAVVITVCQQVESTWDRVNGELGADTIWRARAFELEAEAGEFGGSMEPVFTIL